MNLFHTITAALLAILIASPLCCCAGEMPQVAEKTCCSAGSPTDDQPAPDHACTCRVSEPREAAKVLDLPGNPVVPALFATVELPPPIAGIDRRSIRPTDQTGCDPPRWMLARYARWLI